MSDTGSGTSVPEPVPVGAALGSAAAAPSPPTNPDTLAKDLLTSLVRHSVTGVAGALVADGALEPGMSTHFIVIATGLGVWACGVAWSFAAKWLRAHNVGVP